MSIVKGRGVAGRRQVFSYDPSVKRKRYVGTVGPCSGSGNARTCRCVECKNARELEAGGAHKFVGTPDRTGSVNEWATEWLEKMHGPKTSRPSGSTLRHNRERLTAFLDDYGSRLLDTVTDDDADDFALEHPGRLRVVKAMFADAERRSRIAQDPFRNVRPPRGTGRQQVDPLTESELARLSQIATELQYGVYGCELALLIAFAGWTGLRPGEICGLEWSEVDLAERTLHVWWQRRKDGARVRTKTKVNRPVPLCDKALEVLHKMPHRSGPVFRSMTGRELRPEMLSLYWKPIRDRFTATRPATHWLSRRLRQDPADKLHIYEVRHHFGSVLGDQGLSARDIAAVMGNSPDVCERVYVHPFQSRVQDRVRAALSAAAGNLDAGAVGSQRGMQVVGGADAG